MSFPSEEPVCDADAELNYLKRRVYQEAQAAVEGIIHQRDAAP